MSLFKSNSVDSILASFNKTISDLTDLSKTKSKEAEDAQTRATQALAEAELARFEAVRADKAVRALDKLFGNI